MKRLEISGGKTLTLTQLVEPSLLQQLQNSFAELAEIDIKILDLEGNLLTKPTRVCQLCSLLQKNPAGKANCRKAAQEVNKIIAQRGPQRTIPLYPCYSGLSHLVVPITIQDSQLGNIHVGTIVGSGIATRPLDYGYLQSLARNFQIDNHSFLEATQKIKSYSPRKLLSTSNLLATIANSISEICYRHYKLKKEMENTVHSLAAAIEAKDPYTKGHSTRVAEYSLHIADKLSLPPQQREAIQMAGLLHDIGKIGIKEEILLKRGSLSPEEFQLIREHPLISIKILEPLEFSAPIIHAIRQHHERWDGRGYPDGLKGDKISLEGRIISVADAYDAMTSSRPYRLALDQERVTQELKLGAAKQFDPAIVKVFLEVLEK